MTGWRLGSLQLRTSLTSPVLLQGGKRNQFLWDLRRSTPFRNTWIPVIMILAVDVIWILSVLCNCEVLLPNCPHNPFLWPPLSPGITFSMSESRQRGSVWSMKIIYILSCPPWRSLKESRTPLTSISNSAVRTECLSLAVLQMCPSAAMFFFLGQHISLVHQPRHGACLLSTHFPFIIVFFSLTLPKWPPTPLPTTNIFTEKFYQRALWWTAPHYGIFPLCPSPFADTKCSVPSHSGTTLLWGWCPPL